MKHFVWSKRRVAPARTILKEAFAPVSGIIGITAILVGILALCLYLGKNANPVIPIHVDDGETVDPNPFRFGFMIVGFVVSFILAAIAERKANQGRILPAFWWGYAGGTMLWQAVGECAWHFSIQNEDYLMCFPHIEGASALILVIVTTILILYCWHRRAFGWGVWVFTLAFIGNWFGHFLLIGTFPLVSSLMWEGRWYLISGIGIGCLTTIAAILLAIYAARNTKARLCCCLMLYFGIGMIFIGFKESSDAPVKENDYALAEVIEVEGRQGVSCDGEYYYVSGSTAIYKYKFDGTLVLANEDPFGSLTGVLPALNHIGDIDVFGGEIYAGCEYFMDGVGQNIQVLIYDSATLEYKRCVNLDPASGQMECCGLAVDRSRRIIWMADWVDGSHLFYYDQASGAFLGKVRLDPAPALQQGIICTEGGDILISSDDGDADTGAADHLYFCHPYKGRGKMFAEKTPVSLYMEMSDFKRAGEIEGLCLNPANEDLVVLSNRGARIVLGMPRGFYDGYDHEIHELYIFRK